MIDLDNFTVVKRTGKEIGYDENRILRAISSANKDSDSIMKDEDIKKIVEMTRNEIIKRYSQSETTKIGVEEIQDIIEKELMRYTKFRPVAKNYILYRQKHAERRRAASHLMDSYNDLLFTDSKDVDLKRDNANINCDAPMGIMLKLGTEGAKTYVDEYILDEDIKEAHKKHIVHLHDQDFSLITFNCLYIDLAKLLKNGFNTGHGHLREPNSIRAAASLACIGLQSSQNDCFGGQSLVGFDYALAPYVHKSFVKSFKKQIDNMFSYTSYKNDDFFIKLGNIRDGYSPFPFRFGKTLDELSHVEEFIQSNCSNEEESKIIWSVYENTCRDIENETYQAMEAVIHNLNTLHCLPGAEKIWVYDSKTNALELLSLEHLTDIFEKDRFKVISVNKDNGKSELKFITGIERKDNHRNIVNVVTKSGQKVRVTDNHKMMKINKDGFIDEAYPLDDDYLAVLSPRNFDLNECSTKKVYKFSDYSKRGCIYKNNKCSIESISMDENLAELCGYYVADGSLKEKDDSVITFTVCDKISEKHLNDLVKKIFGENIRCNKTFFVNAAGETKVKSYLYSIGIQATRIIKELCGCGSKNKKVPSDILLGDKMLIRSFLNAYLSCDGKRDDFNSFATINKTLRSQINFLIFRLGELPMYHSKFLAENSFNGKECTFFEGSIGGAPSKRAGLNIAKDKDFNFEIPRYTLSFATDMLRNKNDVLKNEIPRRKYNEIRYSELEEICDNHSCAEDFKRFLNTFSVPIKSKGQENSGEEYVYDLAVEDNENFLTEDCIFVHNSRAGSQTPFSSINFGMDTSPEGRLVIKYLLKATEDGLGNGETPIFPISVFQIKSGVNYNPGDPNYDLFQYAMKVSAKRLFPNFLSLDASYNIPYYKEGDYRTFVSAMGCRTRVMSNVNGPEECAGRGNFAFTTINLPYLALQVTQRDLATINRDNPGAIEIVKNQFFKQLDRYIYMCKNYLEKRYNIIANKKVFNYPFVMGQNLYMNSDSLNIEDDIKEALKNSSLSIGFVGLAECLTALIGKHHGESEEAQKLGLEIVGHIREMTDKFTKETHMNWSTFGSPAENFCGQALRGARAEFGIIPGVTDKEFMTNSSHVPVNYPIRAIDKIKIEAPYHSLENAGHIAYVEMDGDPTKNLKAFEAIIRAMHDNDMGYYSVNHPVDRDPICGYTGIIENECPHCRRREDGHYTFKDVPRIHRRS